MKIIDVKCVQPYFDEIMKGNKKFEIRWNDRNYQLNDVVILKEYNKVSKIFSGRYIKVKIMYILDNFAGMKKGFIIFSFKIIEMNRFDRLKVI